MFLGTRYSTWLGLLLENRSINMADCQIVRVKTCLLCLLYMYSTAVVREYSRAFATVGPWPKIDHLTKTSSIMSFWEPYLGTAWKTTWTCKISGPSSWHVKLVISMKYRNTKICMYGKISWMAKFAIKQLLPLQTFLWRLNFKRTPDLMF